MPSSIYSSTSSRPRKGTFVWTRKRTASLHVTLPLGLLLGDTGCDSPKGRLPGGLLHCAEVVAADHEHDAIPKLLRVRLRAPSV